MEISTQELIEIVIGLAAVGARSSDREIELRLVEADRDRQSEMHGKLLHRHRKAIDELLALLPEAEAAAWRIQQNFKDADA